MTISSGAISETFGRLPAMKMIEPYSPTARAKASAKPVSIAGISDGRITRQHRVPAVGAQARRRLLDFGVEIDQHRLHRAHHERQADEHHRHEDAERREGDLDAEFGKRRAEPALLRRTAAVSATPATAVGSANGMSTIASKMRRPGKR